MSAEDRTTMRDLCAKMKEPEGDGSMIGRSYIVATMLANRVPALLDALEAAEARIRELERAP